MKIGYRTIKTAIATPIAISIAQFLDLENSVTAGIITILCIQPSRKRSVLSAWNRFLACIIASLFSFMFFELFGYSPLVLGVMLAIFIPVTVLLQCSQGITTSSVIIINLFSAQHIDYAFLFNQFMLILVGIGVGLIVNLYMPSLDKPLKDRQKKLEHNFQVILFEIASYLRNKKMTWMEKKS
ncbi:aromatic acid exporter family protein [Paracerasibacillus soli]|uniref:Aromatic acid exporter family protein n=1 Tax=Paracerasibacillus soli TaxID=480284 RepID=A0ABU5CSJ3_9BACI|nr:aromatic acid exporter family protein [Virgibacillus soli]MDY0408383.1 aromatic acid exporter family protein [Virgibacillus soli]